MSFIDLYNKIKDMFSLTNQFEERFLQYGHPVNIPKGYGVYTVWQSNGKEKEDKNLLYIGMVGLIKCDKNRNLSWSSNSCFTERKERYTPYRFAEKRKDNHFKFHFRFGPLKGSDQGACKYDNDAYQCSISYDCISMDFFIFKNNFISYGFTPASLESALLTEYLETYNTLPPANQKL